MEEKLKLDFNLVELKKAALKMDKSVKHEDKMKRVEEIMIEVNWIKFKTQVISKVDFIFF